MNRFVTASSSQCYSDAITDHTVDVVWLTPLTGLEMQKVCDIGCKFNLCHHLHLHAGTKGTRLVQRIALSCKSKQFILREVEAVVYPQDLIVYLIAGKIAVEKIEFHTYPDSASK